MNRSKSNLTSKVRFYFTAAMTLGAVVQTVFFLDSQNLLCTLLALTGLISINYFVRDKILQESPLSASAGVMFGFGFLILPLVVSCFEFRPISRNLMQPATTFGWNAAMNVAIIYFHGFYTRSRGLQRTRAWATKNIGAKFKLFDEPSELQFWFMGFVGLMGLIYTAVALKSKGSIGQGGTTAYIIASITALAYVPYLQLFRCLYAPWQKPLGRRTYIMLGGYFVLILIIAIYRNDRSDFANAIAIVMFCTIFGILLHRIKIGQKAARFIAIGMVCAAIFGPYLTDLAVAMLIVRKEYSKTGARGQIEQTLEVMQDRARIKEFLAVIAQSTDLSWDERYYDPENVFLARFANPKIDDNFEYIGGTLGSSQIDKFSNFSLQSFIARTLPSPVANLLGVGGDKTEYTSASLGDELVSLRYGTGLGSFRVGSVVGHGVILWGFWSIPLFALMIIPFFIGIDSLSRKTNGFITIAPVALLSVVQIVDPYVVGMFGATITFIVRTLPQTVILYMLLFYLGKQLERFAATIGLANKESDGHSGGSKPRYRPLRSRGTGELGR